MFEAEVHGPLWRQTLRDHEGKLRESRQEVLDPDHGQQQSQSPLPSHKPSRTHVRINQQPTKMILLLQPFIDDVNLLYYSAYFNQSLPYCQILLGLAFYFVIFPYCDPLLISYWQVKVKINGKNAISIFVPIFGAADWDWRALTSIHFSYRKSSFRSQHWIFV